jgi:hypothetical protein
MKIAMKANILKEIKKFGFSNEELERDFQFSPQTLHNYAAAGKAGKKSDVRKSSPAVKLQVIHLALSRAKALSGVNPKFVIKNLKIGRESFSEFVVKKSKPRMDIEIVKLLLEESIEKCLMFWNKERSIERFEKKYGDVHIESLQKASFEDPELLEGIILDEKLSSFGRSFALFALAQTHNEEYFSFIKGFVQHESPFFREVAFRGLFEYYDADEEKHGDLKEFFKTSLENEKAPGVAKRITSLLQEM